MLCDHNFTDEALCDHNFTDEALCDHNFTNYTISREFGDSISIQY